MPTSATDQTEPQQTCTRVVSLPGAQGTLIDATVSEFGSGQRSFVFLHGLVGLNEHWEEVARKIHHQIRCVLLEVPLLRLKGDDCSIQGVEKLTTHFLEHELDARAVLVGNSFGGHVALRIAIERPELVEALVLAGSSGLVEKTMVRGAPHRPTREWLTEKIGELFHDRSNMSDADIDRAHRELSEADGRRAMVRLSKSARRNHLGGRIGEIIAPTLLLWGREDVVTPPSAAEEFRRLIPRSRLCWIDECGHAPMLEQPGIFARELLAFDGELAHADRD